MLCTWRLSTELYLPTISCSFEQSEEHFQSYEAANACRSFFSLGTYLYACHLGGEFVPLLLILTILSWLEGRQYRFNHMDNFTCLRWLILLFHRWDMDVHWTFRDDAICLPCQRIIFTDTVVELSMELVLWGENIWSWIPIVCKRMWWPFSGANFGEHGKGVIIHYLQPFKERSSHLKISLAKNWS